MLEQKINIARSLQLAAPANHSRAACTARHRRLPHDGIETRPTQPRQSPAPPAQIDFDRADSPNWFRTMRAYSRRRSWPRRIQTQDQARYAKAWIGTRTGKSWRTQLVAANARIPWAWISASPSSDRSVQTI